MIKDILEYCKKNSALPENKLDKIFQSGIKHAPQSPTMSTNHYTGNFFKALLLIQQPKKILEIGAFVGYLTHIFNTTCPTAKIVCVDRCPNAVSINIKNNMQNKNFHNIQYILGCGHDILQNVLKNQKYDLIFIDADKNGYEQYVKFAMEMVDVGGVIIVDNALWRGNVLTPKKTADFSVNKANEMLNKNEKFHNVLLNIDDGIHIAIKTQN